jgi:hypothetical protein
MADGTSSSSNTKTTVILVVVYVVLIGLSFVGAYNFTVWGTNDSPKKFAAIVTVCLTGASAVMGMIVSFLSLQKNQKSAIDLENLKSDLQTKVYSQKIWTDLKFEHEKARQRLRVRFTPSSGPRRIPLTSRSQSWKPGVGNPRTKQRWIVCCSKLTRNWSIPVAPTIRHFG